MKTLFTLLLLLAGQTVALAQSSSDEKLADAFALAANDSAFIKEHSDSPYQIFLVENQAGDPFSGDAGAVVSLNPHQVYGPIETDSAYIWMKVIAVDSAYRMRVGNIFLDPKKSNHTETWNLAQNILAQLKKGASFDAMCKKYTQDSNQQPDCDLGWFFQGRMVERFEAEILQHRKGDYFLTQTDYGYHIVKVLDNPVKDRYQVKLIQLVRNKFRE